MNRSHFRKRFFSITMTTALVVGMFPAFTLSAASAATVNSIYAAAHMGATTIADTTLPSSIDIGGQSTAVNWNIGADTFAVPYDAVTVSGTANGGGSLPVWKLFRPQVIRWFTLWIAAEGAIP